MEHYSAIDSRGTSWYVGPCYSREDAFNMAKSMGIDVVDIEELLPRNDEEESNND